MAESPFIGPGITRLGTVYSDGTGSIAGTFTSLSPVFDTYVLDVSYLITKTQNDSVVVQFGVGTGPTWGSTNYSWMMQTFLDTSSTASNTFNSAAVGVNLGICDTTASTCLTACVTIKNMQSSTLFKTVNGEGQVSSGTSFATNNLNGIWHNSTTPVTAIRVAAVTGSVASGAAISLYGVMV